MSSFEEANRKASDDKTISYLIGIIGWIGIIGFICLCAMD